MTDPVGANDFAYHTVVPAGLTTGYQATTAQRPFPDASSTERGDTVAFSKQALDSLYASRSDADSGKTGGAKALTWESLFGLSNGAKTLKNGHTEVTTITGSKLLVTEYDGDKLVRKETGVIANGTVAKDVTRYDAAGRVAQTSHSELTGLTESGLATGATLSRSVQWYSAGTLARDYSDSMTLSAEYEGMPDLDPGVEDTASLQALTDAMTKDNIATDFYATLSEYSDGHLAQSATVRQVTTQDLQTNRALEKQGGQPGHSTEFLDGSHGFSASVTNYDQNGKLLRQASYSEKINESGEKTQRLSQDWYSDGELVQRSNGLYEGKLKDGRGINAQLMLETLGMSQGGYSTSTPQTAGEMLAGKYQEASGQPDFYVADAPGDNGQGSYGSARNLQSFQNVTDPYSLTWTNEVYRDGKLAARQEDTEGAVENPDAHTLRFAVGAGLSEDVSPRLLRNASHMDESYDKDGDLQTRATLRREEEIVKDDRGVSHLKTHSSGRQDDADGGGVSLSTTQEGGLDAVDSESRLASQHMDAAADLTLGDIRRMLRGLGRAASDESGAQSGQGD
jgi:hypothetical protein